MSGPKLSAYELEQIRKAELERIRRETAEAKANILRMVNETMRGASWCDQQLRIVEQQLSLLSSSTLSDDEMAELTDMLSARKESIRTLRDGWRSIKPKTVAQSDSHSEVKAEEGRISSLVLDAFKCQAEIAAEIQKNKQKLEKLSDNLRSSISDRSYSVSAVLQSVAVADAGQSNPDEEVKRFQADLFERINALRTHELVTAKMIERLDHCAERIAQENRLVVLRELESQVIKDISYKLDRIETVYDAYRKLYYQNTALKQSLGQRVDVVEEIFESENAILARMKQLEAENAAMIKGDLEAAERTEIAKSIDKAMESLGYRLIGSKDAVGADSVKLFRFAPEAGIQVTQGADGTMQMKVVGLGHANEEPNEGRKKKLVEYQRHFCAGYDNIVNALREQGVLQVDGTQERLPPSAQFVTEVDESEYKRPDTEGDQGATDAAAGQGAAENREVTHTSQRDRFDVTKPYEMGRSD